MVAFILILVAIFVAAMAYNIWKGLHEQSKIEKADAIIGLTTQPYRLNSDLALAASFDQAKNAFSQAKMVLCVAPPYSTWCSNKQEAYEFFREY